ncbi:hypothetical protein Q5762_07315 [Streptomyces sp. P9(2023)]|uniref:hypothetical protein n=1 Tax=Streptomyces sp. P9(2023) TaxID=3064394 RepID=UPI0028F3EA89|nr:hypothetical protein [Streptomyces sp. P9(2023)]MDT9688165.1 hypothetical protein [Streptomyces sp. P9(2023)]
MSRPRTTGAVDSRCPACAAPVITQWVGQVAALRATVDLTPLTPEQQATVREPNRLVWCLYQGGPHTPPRLRWATPPHPPDCGHPHVTEHRCITEPTTLF